MCFQEAHRASRLGSEVQCFKFVMESLGLRVAVDGGDVKFKGLFRQDKGHAQYKPHLGP